MKKTNILVFDGQSETLVTTLSNKDNKQCPFYASQSIEQLNKDFTFDFSVPATHEDSRQLVRGNLVGFFDLDGELQVFQIYKTEEEHNGTELRKRVYTEHLFYELIDDIVTDLRVQNGEASEAMTKALASSRWEVGTVDSLGTANINFYYSNGIENITKAANTYGGELGFRFILDGKVLSQRLVDLKTRRGSDTGNRLEFTKDLLSVKRTEQLDGLKTALFGRGKGEELESGGYSRKETFRDVVWRTIDGDPVDKPSGQEWVGLPEALAAFGREGGTRHRFGTFDVDSTDPEEILELTFQELQRVSTPRVTYELTVITLEQLTGYDHKKVRLGDTVFVIDRDLGLTIEARVVEIRRDLENPENTEIILGNFIEDITDYNAKIEEIQAKITDRQGVWDKADDVAEVIVDDSDIVDIAPQVPTNVSATGLFKSIALKWTFDPSIRIAAYEVYGSRVNNFTPDSSNLLFRGKSGGFVLDADTNQTWYFRIRAVNPHGTVSGFTQQFSASTLSLMQPDFENLVVGNAMISEVSADKITFGVLDGNLATIVNIDADNINAGKLKAQYVEIGSQTTYAAGYDPTTKATPQEVLDAEARAKSHANTKATEAETAAKSYAAAQAELERLEAEAYADGIVSEEEQARIAEAQAKLDEAKDYADTKKTEAIAAAQAYSNTKLTEAQQYAETKATEARNAAEAYAEQKAEAERLIAEAYADGIVTEEEQARIADVTAKLNESKLYADEKKAEAIQAAEGLANQAEQRAKDYSAPVMREFVDAGFVHGKDFWRRDFVGETTYETVTGTVVTSDEAEEGKNLMRIDNQQYYFYRHAVPVNVNRVYQISFRIRQTRDVVSGGARVYAGVATLDGNFQNLTGGAGYHRYTAVAGSTITEEDGWQTFTGIITGIGDNHDNFRAGTRFVRPMFIVNYQTGDGQVEVDYLRFEDITEIQQLKEVVDDVSFRTTENAIISTVLQSSTYESDLAGKANSEDLAGYASTDDLTAAEVALQQEMDNKIKDIDFSPYATKTEVQQTAGALDFKFSSSGGVNLLKNSVGYAGTDFWIVTGAVTNIQNPELQSKGAGSGFHIPSGSNGKLVQTITIEPNRFYTISTRVKKGASGTGYIRVTHSNNVVQQIDFGGVEYDFEKHQLIVEPTSNTMTIEIYGTSASDMIFTSTMVNVGNVALQWQHSAGEVYNTNVLMDLNGVRVISNQYNGYTAITPEEFSGYAEVGGEMKRVFTLNKDVTEVSKIQVENEITMASIKVIPLNSTNYKGWAFIAEE